MIVISIVAVYRIGIQWDSLSIGLRELTKRADRIKLLERQVVAVSFPFCNTMHSYADTCHCCIYI